MIPAIDCGLSYVDGSHESMYGTIKCRWKKTNNHIALDILVPVGSYATLYLPMKYKGKIQCSDKIIYTQNKDYTFSVTLVSGRYSIIIKDE